MGKKFETLKGMAHLMKHDFLGKLENITKGKIEGRKATKLIALLMMNASPIIFCFGLYLGGKYFKLTYLAFLLFFGGLAAFILSRIFED